MSNIKMGSISYCFGEHICELEDNHVLKNDRKSLLFLKTMGFKQFKRTDRSLGELASDAIQKSLTLSNISPEKIDIVIYACTTFGEQTGDEIDKDVAKCLIRCGLEAAYPIGIFVTQCNGFFTALKVAQSLLKDDEVKNLLIVTVDKVLSERTRFKNLAVNSDAAACCILSKDDDYSGNFQFKGVSCLARATEDDLIHPETKEFNQLLHSEYVSGIKRVCKAAQDKSGIRIQDCDVVISHNFSYSALRQIAEYIDVSYEKMFLDNIAKFGHAYACDSLINLESYRVLSHSKDVNSSAPIAVLGTGLYFWGMAFFEEIKNGI